MVSVSPTLSHVGSCGSFAPTPASRQWDPRASRGGESSGLYVVMDFDLTDCNSPRRPLERVGVTTLVHRVAFVHVSPADVNGRAGLPVIMELAQNISFGASFWQVFLCLFILRNYSHPPKLQEMSFY